MKNVIKTLVTGTAISIAVVAGSSTLAAEKRPMQTGSQLVSLPGINPGQLKINPLPDFFLVAVANKHTSGPKGILRHGSCKNDFKVIVRNLGAEYTYGDTLTSNSVKPISMQGGQVLVHLEKFQGNILKGYSTQFINHMDSNEILNVNFSNTNAGHFPHVGTYRIKATVIPCAKGASTTNCKRFPEKNSNNNSRSVEYTVSSACP